MQTAHDMATASPLVARLKDAMGREGINARDLALKAGVGASFVYDILNGHSRNPTAGKLTRVAEALGVTVGWLLEGQAALEPEGMIAIAPLALEITEGRAAPAALDAHASPWRFHREWLAHELGLAPEDLRVFEARDDAMAPMLAEGDMVLVDTGTVAVEKPGIYVILDRLGIALRQVEPEGKKLRITALNPAFPAQELAAAQVRILGRVVWSARKFV